MIGSERALCETLSENMTNPIRSFDLPAIKSIATFLEASKRSGVDLAPTYLQKHPWLKQCLFLQ